MYLFGLPSIATTVIFSTRSPWAKGASTSPNAATIVNVVVACSTLGPDERLTLTLAVALAVLPVSAGLITEVIPPEAGVTVSLTVLPTGTPVVVKTTVTGFGVLAGRVISALPVGAAGAATPATNTELGAPVVNGGVVAAVRVKDSLSSRMRPSPPPPPFVEHPAPLVPPYARIVPFPAIVVATMRIPPPLPPPPGSPQPAPADEPLLPPVAKIDPVMFTVPDDAIRIAPPPPPPPEPPKLLAPDPTPPPDPPLKGSNK